VNLKRQLLLVSILTLILPWAGCEFIQETEQALRGGQQQMLATTARAYAESLQQYDNLFDETPTADYEIGQRAFAHRLPSTPVIDGYVEDWALSSDSLQTLSGTDGPLHFVLGRVAAQYFLFVRVSDRTVLHGQPAPRRNRAPFADGVVLVSSFASGRIDRFEFFAEAPGVFVPSRRSGNELKRQPTIQAVWQDIPGGYQIEARIPRSLLGSHLGLDILDTDDVSVRPVRQSTFTSQRPGKTAGVDDRLQTIVEQIAQPGVRMILTDDDGYRIANTGSIEIRATDDTVVPWLRLAYEALVENGTAARFAEPDAKGREQQPYISSALRGVSSAEWFRDDESGNAIVAVAEPVIANGRLLGALVLQQGTADILSLRNEGLSRLVSVTLLASVGVALALLGYATWLSRRIRRLSLAAEAALEGVEDSVLLPSASAADEIGDLSRGFANVLTRLGGYNSYLRTLASKLSHELRTPIAIVSSSLDNLEQETLSPSATDYTARAKDGIERLRNILNAMSEASRVEELAKDIDRESFDIVALTRQTATAYRDVYPQRNIEFDTSILSRELDGSPELLVQMLDKLVDNAVSFSSDGDSISLSIERSDTGVRLHVDNPGPPLPSGMQGKLFDSMVSMRPTGSGHHLGLGLYIARIIVEGHGGGIVGSNTGQGVRISVDLPVSR